MMTNGTTGGRPDCTVAATSELRHKGGLRYAPRFTAGGSHGCLRTAVRNIEELSGHGASAA
jgi:hypothetical protein